LKLSNRLFQKAGYCKSGLVIALFALTGISSQAQVLGSASSYGVLGGSTVTNTGSSVITGNVGVSPGTAITGFPPGIIVGGVQHSNDASATLAQTDMFSAITTINGETVTQALTGQDLGGLTLTPGVYYFASSAQLTGALTLNGQGNSNSRFDFIIGSTLTTASASSVVLENAASGSNVFWDVGSSATLGTTTSFEGNVLALASITATTGATDPCGSLLAHTGAVTLDDNTVGGGCSADDPGPLNGTPEPSAAVMVLCLGTAFAAVRRRLR